MILTLIHFRFTFKYSMINPFFFIFCCLVIAALVLVEPYRIFSISSLFLLVIGFGATSSLCLAVAMFVLASGGNGKDICPGRPEIVYIARGDLIQNKIAIDIRFQLFVIARAT